MLRGCFNSSMRDSPEEKRAVFCPEVFAKKLYNDTDKSLSELIARRDELTVKLSKARPRNHIFPPEVDDRRELDNIIPIIDAQLEEAELPDRRGAIMAQRSRKKKGMDDDGAG
jgi:hypothetical protein